MKQPTQKTSSSSSDTAFSVEETGWIEAFLEMMSAERGASQNTLLAYRRDLHNWGTLFKGLNTNFVKASTQAIETALSTMQAESLSEATASRRLSTLKHFFSFLGEDKIRQDNPAHSIKGPKIKRRLPRVLSETDVEALFQTVQTWKKAQGARMHCMLELLYGGGLRVSELVSLPVQAFSSQERCFILKGKGGRERLIPLGDRTLQAMEVWRPYRENFIAKQSSQKSMAQTYMFPSRSRRGHITREHFSQRLEKLGQEAGITAKISPHALRHAFATHLLKNGADLRSVQQFLGHANITTTQIYTHIMEDHLRKLVETAHPLARL